MKKIIVAFFAVGCIFSAGYAQDSSSRFSVGILAGPYFNTGSKDFFQRQTSYRGQYKSHNFSMGTEFNWFFKSSSASTKHGMAGRFLYSTNKERGSFKGPDSFYSNTSINTTNTDETYASARRNYLVSAGYRVMKKATRNISLLMGTDAVYVWHEKSFTDVYRTYRSDNSALEAYNNYHSSAPAGYSTGLGLNAGIEYNLFNTIALGMQVGAGIFYTRFSGKIETMYTTSHTGSPVKISGNIYHSNIEEVNLAPLNYTLSARYYF